MTNNSSGKGKPSSSAAAESKKEDEATVRAGSKRKFALDADELDRIAENDKAKARKAIDDEKVSRAYTTVAATSNVC